MKQLKKILTPCSFIDTLFLILLGILGLHSLTAAGFFVRKIGSGINLIVGGIFFLNISLVLIKKLTLKSYYSLFSFVILVITLIIHIVFTWANTNFYPSFILANFKIHPDQFALIPLVLLIFSFLNFPKKYYQTMKHYLFAFSPLIGFIFMWLIKINFPDLFHKIGGEDFVVEYFEFFLYVIVSYLAARVTKILLSTRMDGGKKVFLVLSFIGISLVALFIAGEEISWGQRIFNIQTPEEYALHNHQGETNLHNNEGVFHYVYLGYYFLGLYGGLLGIARWILGRVRIKATKLERLRKLILPWVQTFVPQLKLSLFFLPAAIYSKLRFEYGIWRFNDWEELMEIILVIGICYFIFNNLKNIKARFEQKKGKLKKTGWFVFLLFFSGITKLLLVVGGTIPFSFDHGKDSLAILHLIKTFSPALIGPWTSIPGLFFGPGWYYLLAPAYLLSGGNPLSAVLMMILLNLLTIYLVDRHFGRLEATLFATTDMFITLSTSAWNPFPMPLLMVLILIILKKTKYQLKDYFWLGILSSLSFHFSSAYAVFYLIALPLIVIIKNTKQKSEFIFKKFLNKIFIAGGGFAIPFIPQLLFELRHSFVQSKAVFTYLMNPPANQPKTPLLEVIKSFLSEARLAALPNFDLPLLKPLNQWVLGAIFITTLYAGHLFLTRKKKIKFGLEIIFLVLLPLVGFSQLHYNFWYLFATFPVVIVFFSQFFKELPHKILMLLGVLYLLNPVDKVIYQYTYDFETLQTDRRFLRIKNIALDKIKELADGKSYSSYHYVPDIYDYSYQYLYFQRALDKEKLPFEFSYQPGEISYITQKPDLLKKINNRYEESPKYIFYLVEKPENPEFLESWWGRQKYGKIIFKEELSSSLTLYQATPIDSSSD